MSAADFMPGDEVVAAIKARIAAYETERATAYRRLWSRLLLFPASVIAVSAAAAWGFFAIAVPYLGVPDKWISVLAGVAILALVDSWKRARRPATRLQQSLRNALLPSIFGFVDDVRYWREAKPSVEKRPPREAVGDYDGIEVDDAISGRYRGVPFNLYEAELRKNVGTNGSRAVFDGLIVTFELGRPFPGLLVAARRANVVTGLVREILGGRMATLASGDPDLDADHEFRSDNVEAARPLVTSSLSATLRWLRETWPAKLPRIALSGDRGFLLVPMGRNWFELPPISTPVDYGKHVEPMIADLAVLLEAAALIRRAAAAGPG